MSLNDKLRLRHCASRILISSVLLILVSCGSLLDLDIPTGTPTLLAEQNRVYALVETQQDVEKLRRAALDLGYTPQGASDLSGLGLRMLSVDLPEAVTGREAIMALENAVPGSTVGVNHAYRLQQSSDSPTSGRSYANDLMQWSAGACRAVTAIGLIDGGVDANAPVLSGVRLRTRNLEAGSPSSLRHGTEVASLLAHPSRMSGVTLFSANVIAANGPNDEFAGAAGLVQAIDWLAQNDVQLVNVSLSGPPNKLLAQAVDVATQRGMVLVAAVGNDGRTAEAQFPAALPNVIAVTAVDVRGRVYRDAVRGPHVDFSAPGVDVFVANSNGGRFVTGTSMAAPFVTAILATQTERTLASLRLDTVDLGSSGRDTTYGDGLIQAPRTCQ